jgi:hypothetical protein
VKKLRYTGIVALLIFCINGFAISNDPSKTSIFSKDNQTITNRLAVSLVQSHITDVDQYRRIVIQKHNNYLVVILQKSIPGPIKVLRINFNANNTVTSVIDHYAAIQKPQIFPIQMVGPSERLLIIAVNQNMHTGEVATIQHVYNAAISSGNIPPNEITLLADSETKQALLKVLPSANIQMASLQNVETYLHSAQLTSIFYMGDGLHNAFELAAGDLLTAQDINAMLDDKTQPFSFQNKTFIAVACNAFLSPLGSTITVNGKAAAYMAGITALNPNKVEEQVFINYAFKNDRPFKQAYLDAQISLGINKFPDYFQNGIYGMAGTGVSDLFPKVNAASHAMATIGPLSAAEPLRIDYTFQKQPAILGYGLVSSSNLGYDKDNLQPGGFFKQDFEFPLSVNESHFATTSPASFTAYVMHYKGHTNYMIGDLNEIFALNRFTGSPASEVIYKNNLKAPESMPQRIAYAHPWWDQYYQKL